jgi:hypothetical protein
MTEIKFKIPEDIPIEIIKFELEKELNLKISLIKKIREEIEFLQLNKDDIELFEKARQEAWKETKKKRGL